jgi:hypothetical protein
MSIISAKGDPAYTEAQVLQWVQTGEATYGEIARIGNEDGFTLASFYRRDPAHPRPTVEAKLEKAAVDAPAHAKELCRGKVYIKNKLEHVVVFRP